MLVSISRSGRSIIPATGTLREGKDPVVTIADADEAVLWCLLERLTDEARAPGRRPTYAHAMRALPRCHDTMRSLHHPEALGRPTNRILTFDFAQDIHE